LRTTRNLQNNSSPLTTDFKKWYFFLPEDGILVPKHFRDTLSIFTYNEHCEFVWCNELSTLILANYVRIGDAECMHTAQPGVK